jgi:hypothetical protein
MVWIFELSIECGQDELLARSHAAHFEGHSFALSENVRSTCATGIIRDGDGNFWAVICPSQLSRIGIATNQDAEDMTTAGERLYEGLLSAPSFRYAIAGIETDEFRPFSEIPAMDVSLYERLDGLVVAEEIWKNPGQPAGFVEFRPGYLWRPYQGEKPRVVREADE